MGFKLRLSTFWNASNAISWQFVHILRGWLIRTTSLIRFFVFIVIQKHRVARWPRELNELQIEKTPAKRTLQMLNAVL